MLPLAKGAVTAIASTLQVALGVEACKLIEADLVGRMLPAEDTPTFSAMVATLKEAKRFPARGSGAHRSGAVGLKRQGR